MKTQTRVRFAAMLLSLTLITINGFTINPDLSKHLINLSEGIEGPGYDDKVPEIIVSGNTVHTVWVQSVANSEVYLYYRRSVDLGKTWEPARKILALKYRSYAIQVNSRKLAVDGDNVHICVADYDYSDNGTGRIFYLRSQNGGVSFENERVIAATSGGYKAINNCFIKVSDGKVVVTFQGTGDKKGVWVLFSSDSGASFSDTKISDESSYVTDLYYDGAQMIILHGDYSTSYGYITVGKVWVSVSQNGTSFITNKISVIYTKSDKDAERCRVTHGDHYSSKIASSGNNIHVLFSGYTTGDVYTTFYARSMNKGTSFEPAVDIGAITPEKLHEGSETVAAMNGNVYLLAATQYPTNNNSGNKFYFSYSDNNGSTFSEMRRVMDPEIYHVGKSSLPGIAIDPTDKTGKTLYLTGNWLFCTKSVDGGQTFSGSTSLAPFLESNIINMAHNYMNSFMSLDANGGMHWITQALWRDGKDQDIFYRNVKVQPAPGKENKALYVEDIKNTRKAELVVVPSSESIQFDSAMTAEVWIKFNPDTQAKFNILAKVNGYDGYDNEPTGYQMGFRQDKGKITINAGIKTDRGMFVNWGEIDLNDNLWHHIAFTYDANGGLKNFKMYINGLLHMEQMVTGEISPGDGMLMIGSRAMGNSWYYDAKYHLDDVRLWNRALTQEELLENQTKKLSGQESGLKLFLNFDDTFKDVSENGNDGIPVYDGKLEVSDFDPPVTAFDMYQTGNEVSFNNKTKNATTWVWNFDDGTTSEQGNPKHLYKTAGEYNISLLAKNANSVTASIGHVSIAGLDRIEPGTAGNTGFTSISVFGGGLNENSTFKLAKGETEILSEKFYLKGQGELNATFNLNEQEVGLWDVVVTIDNKDYILKEALTIESGNYSNPYVYIHGRSSVIEGRWQTFTVEVGNDGNIDLLNVPFCIALTNVPGIEVEFINFNVVLDENSIENGLAYIKDSIPISFAQPNFFEDYSDPGVNNEALLFPLIIPKISQKSSYSLQIRIKSNEDFKFYAWAYGLTETEELKSGRKLNCEEVAAFKGGFDLMFELVIAPIAKEVVKEVGLKVFPIDCIKAVLEGSAAGINYLIGGKYDDMVGGPYTFKSMAWDLASAIVSCAGDFPALKAPKIALKILSMVIIHARNLHEIYDCIQAKSVTGKTITARSSRDPNEMVGPMGFGSSNYVQKNDIFPYTILFENKNTATAPAHDVFITDTLDLRVFDISNFGFGSFGWGDTILYPPGNKLKEFSMDIDLRPEINLITRVSAKLDTLTGIIRWEFLSLNTSTLDLEEDPDLGFLPPNNKSPEGEGFVSFTVGLKKELKTNAEIRNKASIVFDTNEPIITNEYLNILDLDEPESSVYPLGETTDSRFPVSWTGTDKGSGIQGYSIYVLENDTLLKSWRINTNETSAIFEGEVGSNYKFFSLAIDNVNLSEINTGRYDASTTITVDVEEFDLMKDKLTVWPNPVKDNLNVTFNNAPCGMYVVELISTSGLVVHSRLYSDIMLQNGLNISVADCAPGQYVLRIVFGNKTETRKIVVQQDK
jgi:PKD repeat protein